jgi:hypothetical protein
VSGEEVIVELINLGPVIGRFAILDPKRAKHVVEDGVETDIAKSQFVDCDF